MSVQVREATFLDVLEVAANMRESDQREIYAQMWDTQGPSDIAHHAYHMSALRWVGVYEERPAAVLGIMQMWPRVWQIWMFGTDEFRKVAPKLVAFARPRILQTLHDLGAHRVEAKSMADHTEAHAFIEKVGGKKEAVLRQYGKNGEDFFVYVKLSPFL